VSGASAAVGRVVYFAVRGRRKRATVTGWQQQQFPFRFSGAELLGPAHDLAQLLDLSALFVNAQFGIAHDVDEKDIGDFQFNLFFNLSRHGGKKLLRRR